MAELNPVSNTYVLLESMLQKLQLNTQSNNSSQIQTNSSSVEFDAVTRQDSSEVYRFGCPSNNSGERDRCTSVWNNTSTWNESPWSHPSSPIVRTPNSNNPFRKIRKHVFSPKPKPKRTPLWRGHSNFTPERDNDVNSWSGKEGTPRLEKYNQIPLDGVDWENRDVLDSEPYQKPPDLLAQTLQTATSVWETPGVRGHSSTLSWDIGPDTGKTTKSSKKTWGEAKRWAKNVKERWREKHRGTENEAGDDGETQGMNEEVQSNLSIDVNNTTTEQIDNSYIRNEPTDTGLDEAGTSSLTFMSDNLLPFSTSNLMEEIFSGTQWAQFLSVNSATSSNINQSGEEEWTDKWEHTDTTKSHLGMTQEQMSPPDSFTDMAVDEPVYRLHGTSQSSVTEFTRNQLQTADLYTNHLQSAYLSLSDNHNSEQMNKQSQFVHQLSNESENSLPGYSQPQVSDLSHKQSQEGKGFIPLLDLSYRKPVDGSSTSTHGSLRRKREHWTKRRESSEDTDENHRSSYMSAHSSISTHSISHTSSLNSYQISEESESSFSTETQVKKRRMDNSRHVRFAEEVLILPPPSWPTKDEEEEEEEKVVEEKEEDWNENPSPRSSFPKWIGSLKGFKRTKYTF